MDRPRRGRCSGGCFPVASHDTAGNRHPCGSWNACHSSTPARLVKSHPNFPAKEAGDSPKQRDSPRWRRDGDGVSRCDTWVSGACSMHALGNLARHCGAGYIERLGPDGRLGGEGQMGSACRLGGTGRMEIVGRVGGGGLMGDSGRMGEARGRGVWEKSGRFGGLTKREKSEMVTYAIWCRNCMADRRGGEGRAAGRGIGAGDNSTK